MIAPRRRVFAASIVLVAAAASTPSCTSEAEDRALEGLDLLKQCDLRDAHAKFVEAHDLDPDDPDIALAFALTDLVLLPEDPALQALAPRLGFTEDPSTTWLWKKGGLLERATGDASCDELGDTIVANVHHPWVEDGGGDLLTTIDESLTLGDLRQSAHELRGRFAAIARALELAAENVGNEGVLLEGGCGVGKQRLQRPELFAIASGLTLVNAAVEMSFAYDADLPLVLLLDQEARPQEWVDLANGHTLLLVDPAPMADGKDGLRRGLELARRAVAEARAIEETPPDAVIDWTSFPDVVLDESAELVDAGLSVLDAPVAVPFLTPAVTVDGPSFFADPIALTPAAPPIFGVDPEFGNVTTDDTHPVSVLGPRFSPNPFEGDGEFAFTAFEQWAETPEDTWLATFDPSGRFADGYGCE